MYLSLFENDTVNILIALTESKSKIICVYQSGSKSTLEHWRLSKLHKNVDLKGSGLLMALPSFADGPALNSADIRETKAASNGWSSF